MRAQLAYEQPPVTHECATPGHENGLPLHPITPIDTYQPGFSSRNFLEQL